MPNGREYFLNLFNVDSKVSGDFLKSYYEGINIVTVFGNPNKIGNYDLMFENKEDVIKCIEKGPGV